MGDSVSIGSLPGLGDVPKHMLAQVVRQGRLGEPSDAFRPEEIDTPQPGPGEVLIAVMAAGINFNNVWAARGVPIDVIAQRKKMTGIDVDFHVGGSDASGIVYALGDGVDSLSVGDEVVVHHGWWDQSDPWIQAGKDPMTSPSAHIWGYDWPRNYGSFAQFTIAQSHQVMPKADHLTWEQAACNSLVGTTAYRMLYGWPPHTVQPGDVVLVWGGSGGLGSQAIQLVKWGAGSRSPSSQTQQRASTAWDSEQRAGSIAASSVTGAPRRTGPTVRVKPVGMSRRAPSERRSGTSLGSERTQRSSSSILARPRSRRQSSFVQTRA